MPTAEILSQGDEVVTGQVADTNAAWLSTRLTDLGFDVMRHTSVGDRLDDLCDVLGEIAGRTDFCIGTGGLGPTQDCSLGLIQYGNEAIGLWGSVPSKASPEWIVERLSWLTPRQRSVGPPKRRGPAPMAWIQVQSRIQGDV